MKTHMPVQQTRKGRPGATLLPELCVAISMWVLGTGPAAATTLYMASGTNGSFMAGQSYNETRAVDVTVLSPVDLRVRAMTLSGIGGDGLAEAVIYDSGTQSLIASAQGSLTDGTITLPVSATLLSGGEYRIGFFGYLGNGTFFLPGSPPYTLPGHFPYTESSGLMQINGAWQIAADGFPTNPNLAVPQLSMDVTAIPEPEALALVGLGLLLAVLSTSRHKSVQTKRPASRSGPAGF